MISLIFKVIIIYQCFLSLTYSSEEIFSPRGFSNLGPGSNEDEARVSIADNNGTELVYEGRSVSLESEIFKDRKECADLFILSKESKLNEQSLKELNDCGRCTSLSSVVTFYSRRDLSRDEFFEYRKCIKSREESPNYNLSQIFRCSEELEGNNSLSDVLSFFNDISEKSSKCIQQFNSPRYDSGDVQWKDEYRCSCANPTSVKFFKELNKNDKDIERLYNKAVIKFLSQANRSRFLNSLETAQMLNTSINQSRGGEISYGKEDLKEIEQCSSGKMAKLANDAIKKCEDINGGVNNVYLKEYIRGTFKIGSRGNLSEKDIHRGIKTEFEPLVKNSPMKNSCIGMGTYFEFSSKSDLNDCQMWTDLILSRGVASDEYLYVGGEQREESYNRTLDSLSTLRRGQISEEYFLRYLPATPDTHFGENGYTGEAERNGGLYQMFREYSTAVQSEGNRSLFKRVLNKRPDIRKGLADKLNGLLKPDSETGIPTLCGNKGVDSPEVKKVKEDVKRDILKEVNGDCGKIMDNDTLLGICKNGVPEITAEEFSYGVAPILHGMLLEYTKGNNGKDPLKESELIINSISMSKFCQESEGKYLPKLTRENSDNNSLIDDLNPLVGNMSEMEAIEVGASSNAEIFSDILCNEVAGDCKSEDGSLGKCNNKDYLAHILAKKLSEHANSDNFENRAISFAERKLKEEEFERSLFNALKDGKDDEVREWLKKADSSEIGRMCNDMYFVRGADFTETRKSVDACKASPFESFKRLSEERILKLNDDVESRVARYSGIVNNARNNLDNVVRSLYSDPVKESQLMKIAEYLGLEDFSKVVEVAQATRENPPPMVVASDDPRNLDYTLQGTNDGSEEDQIALDYFVNSTNEQADQLGVSGDYTRSSLGKPRAIVSTRPTTSSRDFGVNNTPAPQTATGVAPQGTPQSGSRQASSTRSNSTNRASQFAPQVTAPQADNTRNRIEPRKTSTRRSFDFSNDLATNNDAIKDRSDRRDTGFRKIDNNLNYPTPEDYNENKDSKVSALPNNFGGPSTKSDIIDSDQWKGRSGSDGTSSGGAQGQSSPKTSSSFGNVANNSLSGPENSGGAGRGPSSIGGGSGFSSGMKNSRGGDVKVNAVGSEEAQKAYLNALKSLGKRGKNFDADTFTFPYVVPMETLKERGWDLENAGRNVPPEKMKAYKELRLLGLEVQVLRRQEVLGENNEIGYSYSLAVFDYSSPYLNASNTLVYNMEKDRKNSKIREKLLKIVKPVYRFPDSIMEQWVYKHDLVELNELTEKEYLELKSRVMTLQDEEQYMIDVQKIIEDEDS